MAQNSPQTLTLNGIFGFKQGMAAIVIALLINIGWILVSARQSGRRLADLAADHRDRVDRQLEPNPSFVATGR